MNGIKHICSKIKKSILNPYELSENEQLLHDTIVSLIQTENVTTMIRDMNYLLITNEARDKIIKIHGCNISLITLNSSIIIDANPKFVDVLLRDIDKLLDEFVDNINTTIKTSTKNTIKELM